MPPLYYQYSHNSRSRGECSRPSDCGGVLRGNSHRLTRHLFMVFQGRFPSRSVQVYRTLPSASLPASIRPWFPAILWRSPAYGRLYTPGMSLLW